MKKITGYLTHPIRGKAGNNVTDEEMKLNNLKAQEVGYKIMEDFPDLQIYIPADMDDFLIPRGIRPVDVVKELLDLDCAIIKQRDILLVYDWQNHLGTGMRKEIDLAKELNIPIYIFKEYNFNEQQLLEKFLEPIYYDIEELKNEGI